MQNKDMKIFTLAQNVTVSNAFVGYTITNQVTMFGGTPSSIGGQYYDTLKILPEIVVGVSLTFVAIKVETSDNLSGPWFQETSEAVAAGVATMSLEQHRFSATGNYRMLIPIKDRFFKISFSGTGTVTNETITLTAVLCNSGQRQV